MKSTAFLIVLLTTILIGCKNPTEIELKDDLVISEVSASRGAYLVNTIGCADCHSPKVMTEHGPIPDPDRFLSGHPQDFEMPLYDTETSGNYALFTMDFTAAIGPWGTSFAANLTPHATGIGSWKEEQFIRALREGQWKGLEGTRKLLPPMPWENYRHLSDNDLKSIFAYLKTITPVDNVVPNAIPPKPPSAIVKS